MYNRTAAYDSIAAALDPGMEPPVSRRQSVDTTHARRTTTRSSAFEGMLACHLSFFDLVLTAIASLVNVPSTLSNPTRHQAASIFGQDLPLAKKTDAQP